MANGKQQQQKNTDGHILSRLFLVLIMVGLIISLWVFISWLYKPGNFPIKKVELVKPLENQHSSELQKAVAKAMKGGFFSLDVDDFRSDLLATLPWVKAVAVRKVWPDKLLISIIEHAPQVRWLSVNNPVESPGIYALLSKQGVIFNPQLTDIQQAGFKQLPLFSGPDNNAGQVLATCSQISESLQKLHLDIKQCGMNKRRTWLVKLGNDMDIKLGKQDIMQKLQRFVLVFSGQLKRYLGAVDYADLRYANGFSIKWHSESTGQMPMVEKSRKQESKGK